MYAQTTTSGGLAGVVTDPSHAVIPDADIAIKDSAKGSTQSTKTDHDGVYQFFFLAPGRYTLTVTRVGFREEKRTVNVLLGPQGTSGMLASFRTSVPSFFARYRSFLVA
jgi:hypothetical protein